MSLNYFRTTLNYCSKLVSLFEFGSHPAILSDFTPVFEYELLLAVIREPYMRVEF